MSVNDQITKFFRMEPSVWERHANPWSVWTRALSPPLLAAAIWSRVWIAEWVWAAIAAALVWVWMNPRIFRKPQSTHHWASKVVLGERVWLNSKQIPVPEHHMRAANVLSVLSACSFPFILWGLIKLSFWPVFFGVVLMLLSKFWFMDRMVWIYQDMKDRDPSYSSWLY